MSNKFRLIVPFMWFLIGMPMWGCDYCLLTQGLSPLETATGKGLRIDQRYTRLSTLVDGHHSVESGDALETHWTTQLTGFYSLSERFTAMAVVPFSRRFEREGEAGGHHEKNGLSPARISQEEHEAESSFGLGDVTVLGRYQVLDRHTLTSTLAAALQAGVRLPTGSTDATGGEGEVLHAHLQPGTGAFNYLMGFTSSYAVNRLAFIVNGIFSLAGEGKVGEDKYEYGNAINYDAAVRYRLHGSLQSVINVFGAVGMAGEYRRNELLNKTEVEGTAGHVAFLTPGVQVFHRRLIFEAAVWVPVFRDLEGLQLTDSVKGFGGISILL